MENADRAFRQRELVDAVDPERKRRSRSRASRTARLVDHRDRFWAIADGELAVTSAGLHGGATADDIDGGFADEDVAAWKETAVDPIDTDAWTDDEGA